MLSIETLSQEEEGLKGKSSVEREEGEKTKKEEEEEEFNQTLPRTSSRDFICCSAPCLPLAAAARLEFAVCGCKRAGNGKGL